MSKYENFYFAQLIVELNKKIEQSSCYQHFVVDARNKERCARGEDPKTLMEYLTAGPIVAGSDLLLDFLESRLIPNEASYKLNSFRDEGLAHKLEKEVNELHTYFIPIEKYMRGKYQSPSEKSITMDAFFGKDMDSINGELGGAFSFYYMTFAGSLKVFLDKAS